VPTRFGDFVFDEDTRELLRGGEAVPLPPKAFELLRHLLRRRPHAVAKEELHALIWPDTNVTEASLASAASDLRSALNDGRRRPQFIRTVHGFGYAFCGEAQDGGGEASPEPAPGREAAPGTVYRLIWERREIQLSRGENLLGRDRQSVAWFDSPTVSRRHARILVKGDEAILEDLGSRNGTWIGGQRITGPVRLSDLDEVKLGSLVMLFRILEASETQSGS
jgi:DNA-binding winged helix-turn-helix (wHTH) protein